MQNQSSEIKNTAFTLLQIIDELAQPHITNGAIKRFWNWFFVSHGKKAINEMPDAELKEVLRKGYTALKPIYEKTDIAVNLRESSRLNDESITRGIQSLPKFNEIMKLID